MSSNQVPAFPLNAITYITDRSITNAGDVLRHLKPFLVGSIAKCEDSSAEVYQHNGDIATDDIKWRRYRMGLMEIAVAYDTTSMVAVIQAFMSFPIIGPLLVGAGAGSLGEGVSVKMGPLPVLNGDLTAKLEGKSASLVYNFTAMGERELGKVAIF
ncbi:hypothetical protein D9756_010747 [Leucocoprinus leucothites]|uniref:Uncharacterized protein n=1 Tax=Leucocoprinus leucothites TaxID=201217 RepID=A0A8H5CU62_9AGAR|nr:hypothetical protein D9756_010747 [Leucoagaricus leucothites]